MDAQELNTCGCRSCGGAQARADAILAKRVIARAAYVRATRGEDLRNRVIRPALYERLVGATR